MDHVLFLLASTALGDQEYVKNTEYSNTLDLDSSSQTDQTISANISHPKELKCNLPC